MGSLAYVAAARSVLAVGRDPNKPTRRVLVQIKSNLAAMAPGLGFSIPDGALLWDTDPVSDDLAALFAQPGARAPAEAGALAEAISFPQETLSIDHAPADLVIVSSRPTISCNCRKIPSMAEVAGKSLFICTVLVLNRGG